MYWCSIGRSLTSGMIDNSFHFDSQSMAMTSTIQVRWTDTTITIYVYWLLYLCAWKKLSVFPGQKSQLSVDMGMLGDTHDLQMLLWKRATDISTCTSCSTSTHLFVLSPVIGIILQDLDIIITLRRSCICLERSVVGCCAWNSNKHYKFRTNGCNIIGDSFFLAPFTMYTLCKLLYITVFALLSAVPPYLQIYYHDMLYFSSNQIGCVLAIAPFIQSLACPIWSYLVDKRPKLHGSIMAFTSFMGGLSILGIMILGHHQQQRQEVPLSLFLNDNEHTPATQQTVILTSLCALMFAFFTLPNVSLVDSAVMKILGPNKILYGEYYWFIAIYLYVTNTSSTTSIKVNSDYGDQCQPDLLFSSLVNWSIRLITWMLSFGYLAHRLLLSSLHPWVPTMWYPLISTRTMIIKLQSVPSCWPMIGSRWSIMRMTLKKLILLKGGTKARWCRMEKDYTDQQVATQQSFRLHMIYEKKLMNLWIPCHLLHRYKQLDLPYQGCHHWNIEC